MEALTSGATLELMPPLEPDLVLPGPGTGITFIPIGRERRKMSGTVSRVGEGYLRVLGADRKTYIVLPEQLR
jgi:hypothetical protein